MKQRWEWLTFIAALVFFLAACSGESGEVGTENGTENGSVTDGNLVIAQSADITTLDPQDSLSTNGERIFRNMYNRLFARNQDMEIVPEIVESYENVDEETWHFNLVEGITFHNGEELTAEDVKFSLERVMTDQGLKEYPYFTQLAEVNVLDTYTVEIVTDGPMPTIQHVLAKSGADILPKEYVEEVGMDGFVENPIGSGPYQFVSWDVDSEVVLEKFEDYYGEPGIWDTVTVRAISESSTRVGELLTGGVQLITDVTPNEWDRVNDNEGTSLVQGETTRVMLLMNRLTEGFATSDERVREAIDLAIDQQAIVDSVLRGSGVPVRSRVPEGVFGTNPDLYDTYVHDKERAKELLAEAGYEDGLEITLTAPRGRYPLDGEVAELIAVMLGEVGIEVNLELLESGTFIDVYSENENEELIMIGLADGLLDASYSLVHYTIDRAAGQTDYNNPDVDQLFQDASRNLDEESRLEQFKEIQQVVAEERPHTFLYQDKVNYGVSDSILFEPRLDEALYFDHIQPN
ncbi:ABC transporter substrate-binding protein [Ornithinibacillus salinisoli]|uniref:ABC transporter substrate-binding protein n=1 Tax=Ornithinibacillus salinisoli TaxID=1848459 RepID=A0ABW4W219_9BACI